MKDLSTATATGHVEVVVLGAEDVATEVVLPGDWEKVSVLFETNDGKCAYTGEDGQEIPSAHVPAPADGWVQVLERSTRYPSRRSLYLASATAGTTVRVALGGVSTSGAAWNHTETFSPLEGESDYLFTGEGTADTTASHALVTWGPLTLIPDTDYVILADRLRLTSSPPTAEQAASGEVITVRVFRT